MDSDSDSDFVSDDDSDFVSDNASDLVSLRSKCKHFRILVIGRANAGKTTLLKKVCHSIEDPEIFDPRGNRIDAEIVEGSIGRGIHDIKNQLIFKSNPQYIFHDSCGFESGSIEETDKVKSFIAGRAGRVTLSEQLHAIWYCLATDTPRPLLEADEDFFGTDVTGKVPVIAILTKCDAVVSDAFQDLLDEGEDPVAALVEQKTQEMLETRFMHPLKSMGCPPADYVQVKDMHENGDCEQLITKTAGALTDDVLRLLFVSVQQNNINLCIYCAVSWNIESNYDNLDDIVRDVVAWFPHVWHVGDRSTLSEGDSYSV
ncbi:GTP-binding protein [Mycena venus]|uniref:GTP-binding protein n=1 Tax=Mycena venus TaxID=2733690 RepID=A0A8H6Y7V6_9AGAR|nr:GTP-binding protein [Mycena venus]